jgi:hypothetical protein
VTDAYERLERTLNPHRREEQDRAAAELRARLEARGVSVAPGDSGDDLANLDDAVERFDRAVERAGGDLMVDALPSHEPHEARFVLPARAADEAAGAQIDRIGAAAARLRGR